MEQQPCCSTDAAVEKKDDSKLATAGTETRWIVILLVMYFFLAQGFTITCFGQVNNIVKDYFQVSIEFVDWLTVTPSVSSAVSLFLMTWMTASGLVGLRAWCLASASLMILSFACTVAATINRYLFLMAVLGQFFSGVANAINFSLAPLMASSWFSKSEAPTAIALTYTGLHAGLILGFIMPTQILPKNIFNNQSYDDDWSAEMSAALSAVFSSFLAASVIFGFLSFLFVSDMPNSLHRSNTRDAEQTGAGVRLVTDESKQGEGKNTLRRKMSVAIQEKTSKIKGATKSIVIAWLKDSKFLLTEKKFLLLAVPYSVIYASCLIWFALMSDVLRSSTFSSVVFTDVPSLHQQNSSNASYVTTSNVTAGYVMSLYCFGALIVGVFAGKLMKICHNAYIRIVCVSAWGLVFSTTGLSLGFQFGSIEAVYTFSFLFGSFVPVSLTALVTLVINRMTEIEKLTVGTWLAIFAAVTAASTPLLSRLLFVKFGVFAVEVFQVAILTLVAIFMLFCVCYMKAVK